jgi:hypothetical protein
VLKLVKSVALFILASGQLLAASLQLVRFSSRFAKSDKGRFIIVNDGSFFLGLEPVLKSSVRHNKYLEATPWARLH